MKLYIVAFALVMGVCADDTYTTENDDLDINTVVNNIQTLQEYVDCFNDKAECKDVPASFKKDMPEAIQQACAKCTPAQKVIFKVFLKALKEKLPQDFEAYKKKYDPENKYISPLEAAVANA